MANFKQIQFSKIAKKINQMAELDQEMRYYAKKHGGRIKEKYRDVDRKNTKQIKEIIKQIGWPTISKVGKKASSNAWLLVQHADHDPYFQEKCLKLMKKLPQKEIDTRNIAYLEDRVRVNTNRLQIYGTQFYINKKGIFGPKPVKNIKKIDELRKKMNLEHFEEYKKRAMRSYKEWQKYKK